MKLTKKVKRPMKESKGVIKFLPEASLSRDSLGI